MDVDVAFILGSRALQMAKDWGLGGEEGVGGWPCQLAALLRENGHYKQTDTLFEPTADVFDRIHALKSMNRFSLLVAAMGGG